jgi:hypothetical protein
VINPSDLKKSKGSVGPEPMVTLTNTSNSTVYESKGIEIPEDSHTSIITEKKMDVTKSVPTEGKTIGP